MVKTLPKGVLVGSVGYLECKLEEMQKHFAISWGSSITGYSEQSIPCSDHQGTWNDPVAGEVLSTALCICRLQQFVGADQLWCVILPYLSTPSAARRCRVWGRLHLKILLHSQCLEMVGHVGQS